MSPIKTLVLGTSGMLGSAVFKTFLESDRFDVIGTARSSSIRSAFPSYAATKLISDIDVLDTDKLTSLFAELQPEFVINCVGLVKQLPSAKDPLVALPINSLFPHRLARLCGVAGARLVHISTDCVFSGEKGNYVESDAADAVDLYGRSKHLGETVDYDHAITLRTSIIGRELASTYSLVDWFLSQNGDVRGYRRAIFSGLPTDELARVIRDVIAPRRELHGLYHVSAAPISKYDLLGLIGQVYGKTSRLLPSDQLVIDRSLDSSRFTRETGYVAPSWPKLIAGMHAFDSRKDN